MSEFKDWYTPTLEQQNRMAEAAAYTRLGEQRVKSTPPPTGQKFAPGTLVRIADDLGDSMRHFPSGKYAIVLYTYAHAYGGDDVKSYCLDVQGVGEVAWYYEHQLIEIKKEN
jgi:hypothetical protein